MPFVPNAVKFLDFLVESHMPDDISCPAIKILPTEDRRNEKARKKTSTCRPKHASTHDSSAGIIQFLAREKRLQACTV
jgi:hypothetical protein